MSRNKQKRVAAADRVARMIEAGATRMTPEQLAASLGRTGAGKHDSRPNRQRTRAASERAALADFR